MAQGKGQGNFGNPEQHRAAGKKGAAAQPIEAKAKGGRNSRRGSNRTTNT